MTEKERKIEEDDEPDDWWALLTPEGIEGWRTTVADYTDRDKRIYSTGCSSTRESLRKELGQSGKGANCV